MDQGITFDINIQGEDIQVIRYPYRGRRIPLEHPREPLPEGFFVDKVPPEILGLICKAAGTSRDRAFLCRVNHFFYDACTSTLYGADINITTANNLSCLCDTLMSHRPDLAIMIKNLDVRTASGWYNLRESGSR